VAVHREGCRNIDYYRQKDPDRIVNIEWALEKEADYKARIHVEALDRVGLLSDISMMISERNMNIESATVKTENSSHARLMFVLSTKKPDELEALMRDIKNLSDVTRVYRVMS
jgi:GTP pyrophosphokinase